jgi:CMP-N-acetylneuraminic acid synthetase/spore coat polysaccharide biosynthesis predicted glycosyltransferase SpsG
MNILVIIPARSGSKGIPRKNVRLMNNKPLISYIIEKAQNLKFDVDLIVSTDDEEVKRISNIYGTYVLDRPKSLSKDDVTLDPVILNAVEHMEYHLNKDYDIVITLQPTSPLITTMTLNSAIEHYLTYGFDTVISVINRPHLSWSRFGDGYAPNYIQRLNRQYLPDYFIETGAFLISNRIHISEYSRIGGKIGVFEIEDAQSVDIDSIQDWWVAEKELKKKKIIIRVEGYKEIGLGHVYRVIQLAFSLIDHDVNIVISNKSDIGIEKIKSTFLPYSVIDHEDEIFNMISTSNTSIIINDILNTDYHYIRELKMLGCRVINFEDLGEGALIADLVINDLYEEQSYLSNHYWGSKYYILRDDFYISETSLFRKTVKEIIIVFGGTDPNNLTAKVLSVVKSDIFKNIKFNMIVGLGYEYYYDLVNSIDNHNSNITVLKDVKLISEFMKSADLAICSQGRTMFELAYMRVPTILISQNEREKNHEFGSLDNGFINLGLGSEVEISTIRETLSWLINSPQIREQMINQMCKNSDFKNGINRVKKLILNEED